VRHYLYEGSGTRPNSS